MFTCNTHKRSSIPRISDIVGIVLLIFLLIILPIGLGYIYFSILRCSVWLSICMALASSIVILLSLVILLGAAFRFPDHLPEE